MSVLMTTSIVLRQMTALDRMNKRLAELSHLDELTGLFNRRHLIDELRRQLDRVGRGARCGVMMLDLDGFKRVNDELGHDAGDLLLMDIANALNSETRTVDLVARYGGDEFVVVLPDLAADGFLPVAERIVEAVARVGSERWSRTPVTASVGLTMARSDDDVASLLRRADAEAYAAKRAGGNRVVVSLPPQLERSGVMVNVEASEFASRAEAPTSSPRSAEFGPRTDSPPSGRPAKRNTGA
jgi:diguanylate cyclase (GGDEF)-like protein